MAAPLKHWVVGALVAKGLLAASSLLWELSDEWSVRGSLHAALLGEVECGF